MKENRSGITEITADEFSERYLEPKKKANGQESRQAWREEFSGIRSLLTPSHINKLGADHVQAAVAVSGVTDIRPKMPRTLGTSLVEEITTAGPSPVAGATTPAPKQEFAPKIAKRNNRRASEPPKA